MHYKGFELTTIQLPKETGMEIQISTSDCQVVLWAPDQQQAIQLAQQVVDRSLDQQIALAQACSLVHQGAAMYPNTLLEKQFIEDPNL